jgi:hypothetical protein
MRDGEAGLATSLVSCQSKATISEVDLLERKIRSLTISVDGRRRDWHGLVVCRISSAGARCCRPPLYGSYGMPRAFDASLRLSSLLVDAISSSEPKQL